MHDAEEDFDDKIKEMESNEVDEKERKGDCFEDLEIALANLKKSSDETITQEDEGVTKAIDNTIERESEEFVDDVSIKEEDHENTNEEGIIHDSPETDNPIPELEELDDLLDKYQYLSTSVPIPEGQYLSNSLPTQGFHGTLVPAPEGQYLSTSVPISEDNQLPLDEAAKFEMEMETQVLKR